MPKRFTCTEKWEDNWFSDLDSDMKLAWIYILDRCDHAGIWKRNFKNLRFHCDSEKSDQEILAVFEGRFVEINNDKWLIPKFLKFQYPNGLNSNKPAIVGVRKRIIEEGLLEIINQQLSNDYLIISNDKVIIKDKDKDMVKEKVMVKDKRKDKGNLQLSPLQNLWNEICGTKLSKVIENNKDRQVKEKLRLQERNYNSWDEVFCAIIKSDFCCGDSDGGWKANYDWIMSNTKNAVKVIEGNYNGQITSSKQTTTGKKSKYDLSGKDYRAGTEDWITD